jgi:hypothetical protein
MTAEVGLAMADRNRKQTSTVTNGTDTISAMHILGVAYQILTLLCVALAGEIFTSYDPLVGP